MSCHDGFEGAEHIHGNVKRKIGTGFGHVVKETVPETVTLEQGLDNTFVLGHET